MANVSASKKSIRTTKKRTDRNRMVKSKVRTFFRKVQNAICDGDVPDARKTFVEFESVLAKAVKNNVFKKNTASRKLTRLAANIKKIKKEERA
ncbi:MAG: 30S ribosomal protein S20 [Rickettsiales bacterium]|jgi:small subunit ribosomal protein S20|nr:30S ribosomal protein S20 [Rickettsiales bacterium]